MVIMTRRLLPGDRRVVERRKGSGGGGELGAGEGQRQPGLCPRAPRDLSVVLCAAVLRPFPWPYSMSPHAWITLCLFY